MSTLQPRRPERASPRSPAGTASSAAAAEVMLAAVARGRGAMAQFEHPEFGGPGQWMRGGMTMVGDMFNNALKARVEALCADLAAIFASDAELARAPGASAPASAEAAAPGGAWWPAGLPATREHRRAERRPLRLVRGAAPACDRACRPGHALRHARPPHRRLRAAAVGQLDAVVHEPARCRSMSTGCPSSMRKARGDGAGRSLGRTPPRTISSPRSSGLPSCMRAAS